VTDRDPPTPEIIEAAARAMCERDGFSWDAETIHETANGEDPEQQREYWRDKAEAALSAALSVPAAAVVGEPEPIGYCSEYGLNKLASQAHHYCLSVSKAQENEFQFPIYASPSAPEGWQPIETAPKDGRHVILYCDYYGVGRCAWESWRGVWRSDDPNHGIGFPQPTHWMPLPDFPASSVRAEIARRAVLAATNEDQP
jgi:hypothetical protein